MSLIPNLDAMTDEEKLKILESIQKSIRESKEIQKKKVGENVQAVLTALRKIETDVIARFDSVSKTIETRVANIKDGRDGVAGVDGRPGRDGKDGRPGRDGKDGKDGAPGRDGVPGMDGVSVTNAFLDFDNSLVIELSNGQQINAGEVLPPDIAEKLKVVVNTSTGGVGLPEQTGNAGKYLTTDGTNLSWNDIAGGLDYQGTWNASTNTPTLASGVGTNGYYYIVSVAGTTNLDGVTDWQPGDWAIFNGATWQKIDQSWATAGANNNITSMTGITGGISSPDFIQFDTGATVTNAAGRLYWDATQQTLTVGLNANIAADVGQTLYAYATNDEAVTINKGQPVYMFAAQGDRVSVKLASNSGDATSAKTLGVCAENIAAGQAGMILCQGVQDGLDLSAYSPGDTLYVGATAGTLTNVKPYAPNHLVYVGVVERANAGNGRLYVRVQNGYELDELHNVSAQNPSNGQVLIYNESTSLWTKNTLTDGTAISITEGAGSITIANTGVTSLTGTTNEIDVSASTGSVTLSLPSSVSVDLNGSVGAGTPNTGAFTTLAASSTVSGTGFTNYFASPPPIGGTAANTGAFTTLTASADSSFTSTGALLISKGTTLQQPGTPATGMIRYNTTTSQFEGYSGSTPAWKSIGGSALSNDTSTASTLYPVFAGATTGTAENLYTSNAKLLYKPSTGELSASVPRASNGIFINAANVSTSYTIASGDNGVSAGTITVDNGVTVTVSNGSRWVVV
jgi:hypothetical protein